jgi:dihydroxyacetone kinase-like protein
MPDFSPQLRQLITEVASAIIEQSEHLTALDQAIGDGDHGVNMKRGCEAVMADLENIAAKPPGEMLKAVGMALVMKVGGASGPLYGTAFMTLGKLWPAAEGAPERAQFAEMFGSMIEALKARGKADFGAKTLLDVLGPVHAALQGDALPAEIAKIARQSAEATIPLQATRGRASFLGERSIGHMDPGACSSALIIETVCRLMEEA